MNNNSKFIADIIHKDTPDEKVVIKFNNALTNTTRVHKSTTFSSGVSLCIISAMNFELLFIIIPPNFISNFI